MGTWRACWYGTNETSEWLFESVGNFFINRKLPFWELRTVCALGKMLPKPAFCYLLWNHWEYPRFAVWFISITPVWETSMEAWKERECSLFKFAVFRPFFICFVLFQQMFTMCQNFYIISFQEIMVTSKWQLCWVYKCFISFYSYNNPVKYRFVNLEVEDQDERGRGKENWH